MKKTIVSSIKPILKEKSLLAVLIAVVFTTIVYSVYFAINTTVSDIQVDIRYTAFSMERLYRAPWTYLLSFIGFGLAVGVLHSVITVKLYRHKGVRFAVFFGWCSVAMLIIAWLLLSNILGVAGRN